MRGSSMLAGWAAPCVLGCALQAPPPLGPSADLDHNHPIVLNELAAASVQRGDFDQAWLLLERAARLAPHDARIGANLNLARALRNGTPLSRANVAAPTAQAPAPAPPALPPIWAPP